MNCTFRSRVISTGIWFNISSMLGMSGLIFYEAVVQFPLIKCNLYRFIAFHRKTNWRYKTCSSSSFIFSSCLIQISFSNSRPLSCCRCSVTGLAFCLIVKCYGLSSMFTSVSFNSLFSNKSGILSAM